MWGCRVSYVLWAGLFDDLMWTLRRYSDAWSLYPRLESSTLRVRSRNLRAVERYTHYPTASPGLKDHERWPCGQLGRGAAHQAFLRHTSFRIHPSAAVHISIDLSSRGLITSEIFTVQVQRRYGSSMDAETCNSLCFFHPSSSPEAPSFSHGCFRGCFAEGNAHRRESISETISRAS